MRKFWILTTVVLATAMLLVACGGGDDDGGGDGDGGTTLTVTAPMGASTSGFTETALSVPADTPFTIHFVNQDEGILHNVQLFQGTDMTATPVWAPDGNAMINAPDEVDYEIPGMAAGSYAFNCYSHPTTMIGTLTVG